MSKQPDNKHVSRSRDLSSIPSPTDTRKAATPATPDFAETHDDSMDGFDRIGEDMDYYGDRQGRAGGTSAQTSQNVSKYYDVNRYHNAKKKKSGRKAAIIAIVCVVLLLLGGVAVAASVYVSGINEKLTSNVTDELREQLVKTEAGDPFYLLLLGVDKDAGRMEDTENYGAEESNYRSDSIMLCRINPKDVKVTMVSIHRDTLVNMDSHGQQKINAAYSFGGPAYATQTISKFCGVPISHYAEVDLDRFISIVDVVGGVTVDLPVPVYDPEYTELDLPAGEQTLDGTQAALLCRCRHGYDAYGDGDVFRAANQRMVFSAVIKKVLQSDPATLASTVSTMADSVTTDMDVSSILNLAMQMKDLNVDEDIMTGMEPTDGALVNGTWYEICLVDKWRKMMMRVDQGLPPLDENEQDTTAGIAAGVSETQKNATPAPTAEETSGTTETTSTESYEEYY